MPSYVCVVPMGSRNDPQKTGWSLLRTEQTLVFWCFPLLAFPEKGLLSKPSS